ncbi:MAG: hypothetical protein LAO78_14675 [Acidobacteriia bacterium]|nr:hypothetical protein [Terriglobia bacterium]
MADTDFSSTPKESSSSSSAYKPLVYDLLNRLNASFARVHRNMLLLEKAGIFDPLMMQVLNRQSERLSRNRSVGIELGRGKKLPGIVTGMHGMVAEGIFTTTAAVGLAQVRGVEMPITEQMHAILHQGKAPRDAIYELMTRSGKSESSAFGS